EPAGRTRRWLAAERQPSLELVREPRLVAYRRAAHRGDRPGGPAPPRWHDRLSTCSTLTGIERPRGSTPQGIDTDRIRPPPRGACLRTTGRRRSRSGRYPRDPAGSGPRPSPERPSPWRRTRRRTPGPTAASSRT